MTRFRGWLFVLHVVTAAHLCVYSPASAQPDDKVLRWSQQILLGPEFGGKGKVCSRWVKSPTLSVFSGTVQEEKVVAETVAHLNKTLTNTRLKQLTMLERNDAEADIRVYFLPLNEFPTLATRHRFRYVQGNLGYFWTFWNAQHEIERAFVLLASDKLRGKRLRHFALEEITQALGLSNDSPIFPDSIFYAERNDGGKAQELSDLDKKLVTFFYKDVEPGANREDLQAALRKYWPKP